eukprot:894100-Pleurochrysis_carterae.AAC.1
MTRYGPGRGGAGGLRRPRKVAESMEKVCTMSCNGAAREKRREATSDVAQHEREHAWRRHASAEGRGPRRREIRAVVAAVAQVRRAMGAAATRTRMRHGQRKMARVAGARRRIQVAQNSRVRAARRRVVWAVEASARRKRSAALRVCRAKAERRRRRQEPGRAVNAAPVAANRGGGGNCKSRPPATKYTRTRQRPHAQGRRSGDEVMAMARAPMRSAL